MFKVLLLDLDGVLRLWDPDFTGAVEQAHGLPAGTLAVAAFAPDRLQPALTGVVDDRAWRASVADAIAVEHGEAAHAAVHDWMAPAGTVDHGVLEIVRRARSGLRVVLFTNATSRLDDDLVQLGLGDEVDAVMSSADIGMAKPDPDVFSRVALANGMMFSEIAFVDHSPENVATAEILGIRSHLYTGVDGLRTFVDGLLSS
ncbi:MULTISPECIES: HAD family hydrolase [unclassified Knoellia]|uniref:HAD family hydrolase n=1 Tax=Knoellia altitudinis TaxID=3404795 RepID=UPI0036177015